MTRLTDTLASAVVMLLVVFAVLAGGGQAEAKPAPAKCPATGVVELPKSGADGPPELVVDKPCKVAGSTKPYVFGNVHIVNNGTLEFEDAKIDFWAKSILVEKGGILKAGTQNAPITGPVTIHLYGPDQGANAGKGVLCLTDHLRCGVPKEIWESNAAAPNCAPHCSPGDPSKAKKISQVLSEHAGLVYDGPVTDDYFYPYHSLPFDGGEHGNPPAPGYFGYKVLGVSYGGTLQLFGKKGACTTGCDKPETTGQSWVRLNKTIAPGGDKTLVVSSAVDWKKGDEIVVTTTDYLPGHSELLTVAEDTNNSTTVKVNEQVTYHHNGEQYPIPGDAVSKLGLSFSKAETRAAVALLSRGIRIVSEGDTAPDGLFPSEAACKASPSPKCYFGGHVVIRQGFKLVQIQGVEFKQLGQGGRIGHYPIHFHHARKTKNKPTDPDTTFVKDSSINESMTRWIVLHGTHDVLLQRNVGWKSIGHGFYLEDGTEINNKLYANLGIFARAAVKNPQNPREVPGILAAPNLDATPDFAAFPFKSDYDHPTVFWIMNGWNDFQYNMAAGAGTCGACYWLVGGINSTISRTVNGLGPRWESYASLQSDEARGATTPLKSFIGNSCTTAMTSFQTITKTEACLGVGPTANTSFPFLPHVPNPLAKSSAPVADFDYYPQTRDGGRFATQCNDLDCSKLERCSDTHPDNCAITKLDRYTTSFNWAAFNFAAIWLRPQWYLVTDSVITDVQMAGLTMVTGGGYSSSDVIPGHWALVRKSVFIGKTQAEELVEPDPAHFPGKKYPYPKNRFAADGGPFNPLGLRCGESGDHNRPGNYCVSVAEGVSFPVSNFGMYQRLFSVYDGPAFQDSNAYLNIKFRTIDDCSPFVAATDGRCDPKDLSQHRQSAWIAGYTPGLPKDTQTSTCYMPNAAIGWKQPNGFFYPPAFHSANLFFKDVDVRHFVVTPLFVEGTVNPNIPGIKDNYCHWNTELFKGFAGNDRQTVLNDDDGTLTGYKGTTVINLDDFFAAPVEATQCLSDNSSRTSPYEYVTTVLYPKCVIDKTCAGTKPNGDDIINDGDWNRSCTNEKCYGVPLWRQDALPRTDQGAARSIRMMGQQTAQRSSLTVNHGTYYFDTAVSKKTQADCVTDDPVNRPCAINVFKSNDTYYVFLIFAKATTEQVYRFYVGPGKNPDPLKDVSIRFVQANIGPNPVIFTESTASPAGKVTWYNNDMTTGVVELRLKATDVLPNWAAKIKDAKKKKCQPQSYCTWNADGNNGDGACEDKQPVDPQKKDAVCGWAIKDLDCPDGGCVGFVFTLPSGFTPLDDTTHLRPAAQPLKCFASDGKTPSAFNVSFTPVSDGTCPAAGVLLEPDFADVTCDNTGHNCKCVPK